MATIDPGDITAVRNHALYPSRGGYLAGPDTPPVINSDALKQYVEAGRLDAAVQRWAPPEGTDAADLRFPAGVVAMTGSEAVRLASAGAPELRAML